MIEVAGVWLEHRVEGETVVALADVSLQVERGQFVALVGPSGSGKTSLLNLIGGLDRPTRGRVTVDGVEVSSTDDRTLAHFRNQRVGFIFQGFHLDPRRTALDNVCLPLYFGSAPLGQGRRRAAELLERVGLGPLAGRRVALLSGGQRQRVAVARALVNQPRVLLADEPVGHLDQETAAAVLDLLVRLHREEGLTLLAVTHHAEHSRLAQRVVRLEQGRLVAGEGS
ncbi:MAG TPA: ABC transporter ATP-binding protein [Candidatus Nitrosotenuis sp.]|jgi:putative ABC transport system ATP-binding protein|nr:ABC transporter ATP-binding protein [Candidatus Nitrosotenuis sp.]